MTLVTVYTRPGCHLCDDALAVVGAVCAESPCELQVLDIETDETLLSRYLERIPVVAVDGVERFEFFVSAPALREAIANVGHPGPPLT